MALQEVWILQVKKEMGNKFLNFFILCLLAVIYRGTKKIVHPAFLAKQETAQETSLEIAEIILQRKRLLEWANSLFVDIFRVPSPILEIDMK